MDFLSETFEVKLCFIAFVEVKTTTKTSKP